MVSKIYRKYSQVSLVVASIIEASAATRRITFMRNLEDMDNVGFGQGSSKELIANLQGFLNDFYKGLEREGHAFRVTQQINRKFYSDWKSNGLVSAYIDMLKHLKEEGFEDMMEAGFEDLKVEQSEWLH